jgi:hypothetical protein
MSTPTKGLRPVKPLDSIPGLRPKPITGMPKMGLVSPKELYIEDAYQRDATSGKRSRQLIKKIVNEFDWSSFKLPICARLPDKRLVVIDGQHTSIAVATHRGIPKIPVMVIEAFTVTKRSKAFVGHNRNRLNLTPMQIYHASVGAGDDLACEVDAGCQRANVEVLYYPCGPKEAKPKTTWAVGILLQIARKYKSSGVKRVLKVLVEAQRAPITSTEIAAVSAILLEAKATNKDDVLAKVIKSRSAADWKSESIILAEKEKIPIRVALSRIWMKRLK